MSRTHNRRTAEARLLSPFVAQISGDTALTHVETYGQGKIAKVTPGGSTLFYDATAAGLTAALAATADDDIVLVPPGTYAGNLSITKSITLASTDYSQQADRYHDTIISGKLSLAAGITLDLIGLYISLFPAGNLEACIEGVAADTGTVCMENCFLFSQAIVGGNTPFATFDVSVRAFNCVFYVADSSNNKTWPFAWSDGAGGSVPYTNPDLYNCAASLPLTGVDYPTYHQYSTFALYDAGTNPTLHANDTDDAPTTIHHTLGAGANQAAPGNHVHSTVLEDHDHSGDAGDGGTFDAANLTSGAATDGYVLTADGSGGAAWEAPGAGSGDVVGPGTATDGNLAVFDGTTGKLLKDGGAFPYDGWYSPNEAWSYVGAGTIGLPADGTNRYNVGDPIKLTQGGTVKYFYATNISGTLLTVTAGTSYTLVNAAIANPYYSKSETPAGFPGRFGYTPTLGGFSSNPTTVVARFSLHGKMCFLNVYMSGGGTSNAGTMTVSLPVNSGTTTNSVYKSMAQVADNGTAVPNPGLVSLGANWNYVQIYKDFTGAAFTASGVKYGIFTICYEVAG